MLLIIRKRFENKTKSVAMTIYKGFNLDYSFGPQP